MRYIFGLLALLWAGAVPAPALAQQFAAASEHEVVRGEVLQIQNEREAMVAGTDIEHTIQTLLIEIKDGSKAGELVTFENDVVLLEEGDVFFLHRQINMNGEETYLFKDYDRRGALLWLTGLFFLLLIVFAGWQGLRSIAMLLVSFLAILFVLVPLLLQGYDPVWVSFGVSVIILALVFFGTHGFKPSVTVAFVGTVTAVVVTCLMSLWWMSVMRLSGFGSDAAVYLNFNTDGRLDFAGLLLGSIIIGILGVLDDVSITQASVVEELKHANPALRMKELYRRAIRVGRDHVSSLVNTLALAYVGVSLPLVLFLSTSEDGFDLLANQEVVAAELVRIIIGSIGVILAVPLTTLLAAWWYNERVVKEPSHAGHSHHH